MVARRYVDTPFVPAEHPSFLQEITDALIARGGVWRNGEVWFCCLTHEEKTASAHWHPGNGVWHCFACQGKGKGGGALALAKELGLRLPELSTSNGKVAERASVATPNPKAAPKGEPKEYKYFARDGKGGYVHVQSAWRQDFADGSKELWQAPAGMQRGKVSHIECPLYGLKLIDAHPADIVWFVEGEKCAERLRDEGLVAVTNVYGAGKWEPRYTQEFAGRKVVILPDNDEPGINHARRVAKEISSVAESVRIVPLPGLPDKGDVYDWFAAGGDVPQLARLAAKVRPLKKTAPAIDHARVWVLSDLLDNPPVAPESLVGDGILYPGGFAMLAGQPGYGKSWLSFDLALSTSLGDDWLQHRAFNCPRPLRTGMISMEMPIHFMAQRFQTLLQAKGMDRATAMKELSAGPFLMASPPAATVNLSEKSGIGFIADFVIAHELDLLIMDPFSRFHWIDENDAEAMGKVLAVVDTIRLETGCAIMLVHHTRKPSAATKGEEELSSVRGSSRLLSDPQTIFLLTRKGQQPILRLVKANFAPPMDDLNLERLTHGGFAAGAASIPKAVEVKLWIMDLLERNPGGLSVSGFLTDPRCPVSRNTLYSKLAALVGEGLIFKMTSGKTDKFYITRDGL